MLFHLTTYDRSVSEGSRLKSLADSLYLQGLWPGRCLCPWISPGKNIAGGAQPSPLISAHSQSYINNGNVLKEKFRGEIILFSRIMKKLISAYFL